MCPASHPQAQVVEALVFVGVAEDTGFPPFLPAQTTSSFQTRQLPDVGTLLLASATQGSELPFSTQCSHIGWTPIPETTGQDHSPRSFSFCFAHSMEVPHWEL